MDLCIHLPLEKQRVEIKLPPFQAITPTLHQPTVIFDSGRREPRINLLILWWAKSRICILAGAGQNSQIMQDRWKTNWILNKQTNMKSRITIAIFVFCSLHRASNITSLQQTSSLLLSLYCWSLIESMTN